MSCVMQWWDVLFVKGMHFSSKKFTSTQFTKGIKLIKAFGKDWLFFVHKITEMVLDPSIFVEP